MTTRTLWLNGSDLERNRDLLQFQKYWEFVLNGQYRTWTTASRIESRNSGEEFSDSRWVDWKGALLNVNRASLRTQDLMAFGVWCRSVVWFESLRRMMTTHIGGALCRLCQLKLWHDLDPPDCGRSLFREQPEMDSEPGSRVQQRMTRKEYRRWKKKEGRKLRRRETARLREMEGTVLARLFADWLFLCSPRIRFCRECSWSGAGKGVRSKSQHIFTKAKLTLVQKIDLAPARGRT